MRPSMEEYEDLEDAKPSNSRAMSWMVLAVAVGGFAALAYYAYNSGSKGPADGEVLVVEADGAPIKEVPANAEGEQFLNKDKTIYDVIASADSTTGPEKLLPDAETPVTTTATDVEDTADEAPVAAITPDTAPAAVAPVAAAPSSASATTTFVAKEEAQKVAEVPVATAPAVVEAPVAEKSISNPEMVNEKPVIKKPVAKKVEKPAAPKPVAKPVAAEKASTGGVYKIQLGAFKSEEEVLGAWKKISAAHGLSGSPSVVQAEVNGATWFRLRTGSYDSKDAASAACASLGGQACFPVK